MIYNRSTIGPHVKAHMQQKYGRWTQTAANNLGVSPSYLCQVETGKKAPSKKILDDMDLVKVVIYVPKDAS